MSSQNLPHLLEFILSTGHNCSWKLWNPSSFSCLSLLKRGEKGETLFGSSSFLGISQIDVATVCLHFLFCTFYFVCFCNKVLREWRFRRSKPESITVNGMNGINGINGHSHHYKSEIGFIFKAAEASCVMLIGINLIAWLIQVFCLFREASQGSYGQTGVLLVELIAWIVIAMLAWKPKAACELNYPPLLRIWWAVSFLLSLSCLLFDIIGVIREGNRDISVELWVSVLSFPAATFLGAMAIYGKTGIHIMTISTLQEPFLVPNPPPVTTHRQDHVTTPYDTAGFLGLLTLSWLNPLLSVGARKMLELKDVPRLAPKDRAETSYLSLKASWDKLSSARESLTASLAWAIAITFWREALCTGIYAGVNTVATYVGPFLVNDFVDYLNGISRFQYEGYALASLFLVAKLLENVTQRQWYLGIDLMGMHVRAALTAFVYQKGLRLSNLSRQSHTSGEIINYMAVDVQRIGDYSWYLHDIWVLPLQIILALAILYRTVGLAFIATLAATVLSIVSNTPLAKLQERYQDELMAAKDERMRATAECLRSMRILKLQAWEQRYCAKLDNLRMIEYSWLQKALYTQAAVTFIFWGAPIFVSVITFGTCFLIGIPLTAGRVLSALATFRVLQEPLRNFPDLVSMMAQTKVSLERISSFLQEEELQQDAVVQFDKDHCSKLAIEIKEGKFSWDPTSRTPTLSGIDVSILKGMRVAVCGTVGSGKSSFLSCLLGEIPKISGSVKICGRTAYVSQSAWIQTGNIEENILFGHPMDKTAYKNVLRVCELEKDLSLLSYGDQTMIGERGINLSGGQKQRVQLARAVYQDADIYLLDDPFSAVDAHTGTQLFKECILGALALKTVVYVTHQVEFLPTADLILGIQAFSRQLLRKNMWSIHSLDHNLMGSVSAWIHENVLRNGEIIQAGKYEDLLQAGTDFSSLVSAHNEAIEAMDVADYLQEEDEESDAAICLDASNADDAEKSNDTKDIHKYQGVSQVLEKKRSFVRSQSKKDQSKHRRKKKQIIQEEEREKGSVKFQVYWSYLSAAYKGSLVPIIILAQVAFQLLQISSNWWMAWASPKSEGDQFETGSLKLILVYMGLAFSSSICVFLRAVLVAIFGLKASQKLFISMLKCIFRAPMAFFDATPAGRILNRVSIDQSVVDLDIPFRLAGFASTTIQLLGIVGVMVQVTWQVLFLFVPAAAACLWMQKYYMASARELTRLVSIQKSPIIHHFSESVAGVATIRGFKEEERFKRTNLHLLDSYGGPYFNTFAAIEWLCLRMELLSTLVFALLMFLIAGFGPGAIDASMAGLAVTYGLNLNARQSRWVLSLCKLENKVISIERIQQYTRIPTEAPLVIEDSRPPTNWPLFGSLEFHQLKVRYSENLPVVLHGISCIFPGGKKIGIVGRTGSGKSTLIQALFRMVEPSAGRIIIDGLDISKIGLHDLRSRISIIPQDPTLFEGTMRANLDPLGEHSDSEIWEALEKCQLGDTVRSKEDKLDTIVSENGENWSVGQRQLVCLGRVLLKRARILVLDEATASVDTATDGVVQRTLRNEFWDCTVLTVAHRIPTVIDSDLVLVLSDGRITEYDSPAKLLEDKTSLFFKLVSEYSLRSSSVCDNTYTS